MATVYGVNKTKALSPIGTNIIGTGENKAQLNVMYDSYEAAAAASGDIVQVCDKLPAGALVVDVVVFYDDLGTGVTLDVGDLADDNRYVDAAAVAAGTGSISLQQDGLIAGIGYKVGTATNDNQVALTIGGSAATGTLKVMVVYSI